MAFSFLKKLFGNSMPAEELPNEAETPAVPAPPDMEALDASHPGEEEQGGRGRRRGRGRGRRRRPEQPEEIEEEAGVSLDQLQEFVLFVAAALVDFPDALALDVVEKDHLTVIRVRCEKSDIGKIVGKSGKTISAIRALLSGVSGRYGQRVTVDVLD